MQNLFFAASDLELGTNPIYKTLFTLAVLKPLQRSFYQEYTPTVAKRLLGKILVRRLRGRTLSGIIAEVEAYRGGDDPASHAYRGETRRNKVMFGEPGHAYVYFTYGFHYCLNVTTERVGVPGAVLIRALEPVGGVEMMMKNRDKRNLLELTNGPGKLTQALGVDDRLNGEDLVKSQRLFIAKWREAQFKIGETSRVGIDEGLELKWRYFVEGNKFVSKMKLRA